MAASEIYLIDDSGNRYDCTGCIDGLENYTDNLELNDSGAVTFSTSSEIRIGGINEQCYQLLKDKFFDCNKLGCIAESMDVEIYFNCCKKIKKYKILPEFIEWCFGKECYFKIKLSSNQECEQGFDCLSNSLFWAEGFEESLSGGVNLPQFGYDLPITGTGFVPAVPINDIIDYHFDRCGIEFCSSILSTAPYDNLALGFDSFQVNAPRTGLEQDKPLLDVIDILDKLKCTFNAEYRLVYEGGKCKMYFERRDYFSTPLKSVPLDWFVQSNDNICIGYADDDDSKCKSTSYTYEAAGVVDFVSETGEYYNHTETWTTNNNRQEICEQQCGFHSVAFDPTSGKIRRITRDQINQNTPLLFAWDGVNTTNAQVHTNPNCGQNYPVSFVPSNCDNLFDNFHSIDNPDTLGCKLEVKDNISLCPNGSDITWCELLALIDDYGLQLAFEIPQCDGQYIFPSQISIDYNNHTITLEQPIVL